MPLMNAPGSSSLSGQKQMNTTWACETRTCHVTFAALGKPLDWEAALLSPLRADFFEVTDYVIANDPAVASYLDTGVVDVLRWQQVQREQQSKVLEGNPRESLLGK